MSTTAPPAPIGTIILVRLSGGVDVPAIVTASSWDESISCTAFSPGAPGVMPLRPTYSAEDPPPKDTWRLPPR